ncbi:MAG: C39 family peptidase [Calditrichaeota bacterium]|nr:C39 family peptidase [Calditrichota bacterium]
MCSHLNRAGFVLLLLLVAQSWAQILIDEIQPLSGLDGTGHPGENQLVLYNSGPTVSLAGWTVAGDSLWMQVALPAWTMPEGAFLRVDLGSGTDDADFSDGLGLWHAGVGSWWEDGGSCELGLYNGLPSSASIVDFVAAASGEYIPGVAGGHASAAGIWTAGQIVDMADWSSFSRPGRLPSGRDGNTPGDWGELLSSPVTPLSEANPLQRLPLDGSLIDGGQITFEWRSLGGPVRLEIDDSTDWASPLHSVVLSDSLFNTTLPEGRWFWRVSPDTIGTAWPVPAWGLMVDGGAASRAERAVLPVPQRMQHKDSGMLCIWNQKLGRRWGCQHDGSASSPWDGAHNDEDQHILRCEHCSWYCMPASIQMLNNFFGGTLFQDEIAFHLHGTHRPTKPEGDLGHRLGAEAETNSTAAWALGGRTVTRHVLPSADRLDWDTLTTEIDAGRPILAIVTLNGSTRHAVVVDGYRPNPSTSNRGIRIKDPWPGRSGMFEHNRYDVLSYYTLQAGSFTPLARDSHVTLDSDHDGIVDLDEGRADPGRGARTFCSSPDLADSDRDDVPDKAEIFNYTFHRQYHASHSNRAIGFADGDSDGLRAECDCDSDNDVQFDGGEDVNGDGQNPRGGLETCQFSSPHSIGIGFLQLPDIPLCREAVYVFGNTFHARSAYPYELVSPCSAPVDSQAIGHSGMLRSDSLGVIPLTKLGVFAPGSYRVIVDILRDQLYSSPDNWDPWNCFVVLPHFYLINSANTDTTAVLERFEQALDSLDVELHSRTVAPGEDGPNWETMLQYDLCCWATGGNSSAPLTQNDIQNIITYLDHGGRLLLTGNNIASSLFENAPTPLTQNLFANYLATQPVQPQANCPLVLPQPGGILEGMGPLGLQGGLHDWQQADMVAPLPQNGGQPVAFYDPQCPESGAAGILRTNGPVPGRSLYFPFAIEDLAAPAQFQELLARSVQILHGFFDAPPAPQNLRIGLEDGLVRLDWDPVPDAVVSYSIWASYEAGQPLQRIAGSESTHFVDGETPGHTLGLYRVVAEGGDVQAAPYPVARIEGRTDVVRVLEELQARRVRHTVSPDFPRVGPGQ